MPKHIVEDWCDWSDVTKDRDADPNFCGNHQVRMDFEHVNSVDEGRKLVNEGFSEDLTATLDIVNEAVSWSFDTLDIDEWSTYADVSGAFVNVEAYNTGVPENMLQVHLAETRKEGRVVTLVLSQGQSAAINTDEILARGRYYMALCEVLQRAGYGVRVFVDISTCDQLNWNRHEKEASKDANVVSVRWLVKDTNDVIDNERLIFALAHPSVLRIWGFATQHKLAKQHKIDVDWLHSMGYPCAPLPEHYPEDSLIVRSGLSSTNISLVERLKEDLIKLGVLQEAS